MEDKDEIIAALKAECEKLKACIERAYLDLLDDCSALAINGLKQALQQKGGRDE